MKILINAMTIKEGGGAVVFARTFNEMIRQDRVTHWILVVDEKLRSMINTNDHVTILTFPWIKKSPFHLLYWNEIFFPRLIRKMKIDCVYSQINTLPFRKLPCPAYLSVLHAGYFSKEFISLQYKYNTSIRQRIGWEIRKHWVFSSIKKADKVTVPTQALGDEIIDQLNINKSNIITIHPGVGLAEGNTQKKTTQTANNWRIGYITKYGVQKNFEVLFSAAAQLKLNNVKFKLVLTLNEMHAQFRHVKELIEKYDISDVIENYGELSEIELRNLFSTLDLFIFPSLCESIGFTLLEAMHYGIPVISAHTPSNYELLGENGVFFHPHDSHELFEKIIYVMKNESIYLNLSEYSIVRSQIFSWENSARKTLNTLRVSE